MLTFFPESFRIDVSKGNSSLHLVSLDKDQKAVCTLQMSMIRASYMITHILTAMELSYKNEPASMESLYIGSGTPWSAPLKVGYTRGYSKETPPGLIFQFGPLPIYFGIQKDIIADVLGKFLESHPEYAHSKKPPIKTVPPDAQRATVSNAKLDDPFDPPPYREEHYRYVGMITLCWGTYETRFHQLLETMIAVTGDVSEPNILTSEYNRRREHCRKLIKQHFVSKPSVRDYLFKILDDSVPIFQDRNALLHGKVSLRINQMPDGNINPELETEWRLKGRIVKTRYSLNHLDSISHKLMNLVGRINLTYQNPVPGLSSQDMQVLRELMEAHRSPAISPSRPDRPPSSQG